MAAQLENCVLSQQQVLVMGIVKPFKSISIVATAVGLMAIASSQVAASPSQFAVHDEAELTGLRIQFDNDLFAGGERDRDYTGGLALTLSGTAARDGWLSLDSLLSRVDGVTAQVADVSTTRHARQFGLMVFTPGDILSRQPVGDDRPYASMLFTTNARTRVESGEQTAWSSSLTLGVLGLSISERLHNAVHDVVGSEQPRGYEHQISAGGEPTARYTLARQQLLVANASDTLDVKATVQGSVGFLTETSAALSMRIGRFSTPWWGFAPELTDYIAAPTPIDARGPRSEMYFFAGARVKARAYNAFLQGQFRDSTVQYSSSDLEPVLAEAWAGFVTQLFDQTQLSYTLNYQTAEVRHAVAARDYLWGAVQFSHSF